MRNNKKTENNHNLELKMDYDIELLYSICFSELVYYPDGEVDSFMERTEFRNIRDFL